MRTLNQLHLAVLVAGLLVLAMVPRATAQADAAGKATLGIHSVEVGDALGKAVAADGARSSSALARLADSMGQQLIDRIHNTRKFTVVSRSDLDTLLKDQDLQRVLSDPSDANVAQAFQIAGCKYALIVTIDDFEDREEQLHGDDGRVLARKRTVRLSAVTKIYDTTSGKLLESASLQLSQQDGQKVQGRVTGDANSHEELLTAMAREMAARAAARVMDVVFPAKILAMTGKFVTINRGDGTGITRDQIWNVFAIGEALVDPDTGEVLGVEEVPVGKVKVVSVTPKFSRAEVVEDYGVDKLQIVRPADVSSLSQAR